MFGKLPPITVDVSQVVPGLTITAWISTCTSMSSKFVTVMAPSPSVPVSGPTTRKGSPPPGMSTDVAKGRAGNNVPTLPVTDTLPVTGSGVLVTFTSCGAFAGGAACAGITLTTPQPKITTA